MNIRKISLEGRVPKAGALSFLSVEVPVSDDRWIPFALVRYSSSGEIQHEALRLDLDKRTFADDIEDQNDALQAAGGKIVDIVAAAFKGEIADEPLPAKAPRGFGFVSFVKEQIPDPLPKAFRRMPKIGPFKK